LGRPRDTLYPQKLALTSPTSGGSSVRGVTKESKNRRKGKVVGKEGFISEGLGGGRKSIILLEGSQASPARPSDKGSVKVKTLGRLEVETGAAGFWISELVSNCIIWKGDLVALTAKRLNFH
jgi:hypothetical protein